MEGDAVVIFVEANIGGGKSSFLEAMKRHLPGCAVVPESVPKKYLPKLYEDLGTWAYPFQLIIAAERKFCQDEALELEKTLGTKLVFLERSLYADSIFANLIIQDAGEKSKYLKFRECLGNIVAQPDLIIYLFSPPEVCLERIKSRMNCQPDRKCEDVVDLEYLRKLHEGHESWLRKLPGVLVIDTTVYDCRRDDHARKIIEMISDQLACPKSQPVNYIPYMNFSPSPA